MYRHLLTWSGSESGLNAASSARKANALCAEMQQYHNEVGKWKTRGWHFYKLYPKHHQLIHVLEDELAKSGLPTNHWCYCDESEIGAAVRLAESVHPSKLHVMVIPKSRLL